MGAAFSEAVGRPDALGHRVAETLAKLLGAACVVAVFGDDGTLESASAHADDPGLCEALVAEAPRSFSDGSLAGLRQIQQERRIIARTAADPTLLPAQRALLARFGLDRFLTAPLAVRGRVFGLIVAVGGPGAPLGPGSEETLVEVVNLAALALDGARLLDRALRESREREAAERRLEESTRAQEILFEDSPVPMLVLDPETLEILEANEAASGFYGYGHGGLAGVSLTALMPPSERTAAGDRIRSGDRSTHWTGSVRNVRRDGSPVDVDLNSLAIVRRGRPERLLVVRDVTKERRLAEQFRQAQKMEAVGRLAGGVAHDFNNLLTVILTYSRTLADGLPETDPARADLVEIRKAGERAAALTRQLLAFSRQQALEPRVLDLNDLLENLDRMLRRLIGEDIELTVVSGARRSAMRADPGQIEQVVMNLVVNARDATSRGGRLTLETAEVELDETFAREHLGVRPGPYVMLAVSDNGAGMDRATQARIFEPFFTTKEPGKGTGLGLATVFGIVQQSGGAIYVYSEPGKGTTFKLYFPVVDEEAESLQRPPRSAAEGGTETVLLVEDEDAVRAAVSGILRRAGYQVVEAQNAGEALLVAERHPSPIHLLLTDVVMPHVSGPELAKRLAARLPGLRTLCMSGYTGEAVQNHRLLGASVPFLQKPITPDSLLQKVREVLVRPSGAA